jgi:hypothetical protein
VDRRQIDERESRQEVLDAVYAAFADYPSIDPTIRGRKSSTKEAITEAKLDAVLPPRLHHQFQSREIQMPNPDTRRTKESAMDKFHKGSNPEFISCI